MVDFAAIDARRYLTVDVRSGYGEWVATYEQSVEDAMDIALLDTLREVPWSTGASVNVCGRSRPTRSRRATKIAEQLAGCAVATPDA